MDSDKKPSKRAREAPKPFSQQLPSRPAQGEMSFRATSRHSEASNTPRSSLSMALDPVRPSQYTGKEPYEEPSQRSPIGSSDRTFIEGMVFGPAPVPEAQSLRQSARASQRSSNAPKPEPEAPKEGSRQPSKKRSIAPKPEPETPKEKSRQSTRASQKLSSTPKAESKPPKESSRQPSQAAEKPVTASKKPSQTPAQSIRPTSGAPKKSGLVKLTEYENNPMIQKTYPETAHPAMAFKSLAPASVKSVYTNPKDEKMASRQPMIEDMHGPEKKEQEEWAAKTLRLTGACPDAFSWRRVKGGYHCKGEHHFVTDDLMAENKGGVYLIGGDLETERWGPYYESNEDTPGLLWYAGEDQRPDAATDYIGETDVAGKSWLEANYRAPSPTRRSWHASRHAGDYEDESPRLSGGRSSSSSRRADQSSSSEFSRRAAEAERSRNSRYPNQSSTPLSRISERSEDRTIRAALRSSDMSSRYDPSVSRYPDPSLTYRSEVS